MANPISVTPIGFVTSPRSEVADDNWGEVVSTIRIDASWLPESSLDGIEAFSHLEVVFHMHLVDPGKTVSGARHPRNLSHLPKVGIFAQRAKGRPNCLGVSRCQLLGRQGYELTVKGLDAVDGTPVLDIKPWIQMFAPRGPVHEPAWVLEIMKNYF